MLRDALARGWFLLLLCAACSEDQAAVGSRCVAGKQQPAGATGADGGAGGSTHLHPDSPVPAAYRQVMNPYSYKDPSLAALGQPAYTAQCARCHGADGHGCGPEADRYDPPPDSLWEANIYHNDPYLFWRIREGAKGAGLNSAMPAFRDTLGDDEIWRVILYVRLNFFDPQR